MKVGKDGEAVGNAACMTVMILRIKITTSKFISAITLSIVVTRKI